MALTEAEQAALDKKRKKYLENVDAEISAFLNDAFKTHAGRATIWWLLELGQVNTQPFRGDAERTAFACGELNVGNRILSRITALNPDGYITMLKEKQSERDASNTIDAGSTSGGEPGSYDPESGGDTSRDD